MAGIIAGNSPVLGPRGSGGGEPTGFDILTIEYDIGEDLPLVTTAAPHGLSGSETIVITGNSEAGYNSERTVGTVPSATTFFINGPSEVETGTGGTWALA